jgi:RNA 2',3'-cyclic 3'-phosphodiesterase
MPRLFTGFEIPAALGFELSLKRGGLLGARWIEPSDYHITLRFIGDIDHALARDIDGLLTIIRATPIELTLDGLMSFGGDKPRILAARVKPSSALLELQAEQERLMRRLGLAPEPRKYTPHVTLARLRGTSAGDLARFIEMNGFFQSRSFTANRFALYSSKDSVGGGPYIIEATYPLF